MSNTNYAQYRTKLEVSIWLVIYIVVLDKTNIFYKPTD
jgi:hypothetical protein